MKPKQVKKLLLSEIKSVAGRFNEFCVKSDRHFTRNRKLPFETVIKTVIGMESKSLTNELINVFDSNPDLPSASAFVQQRSKIKPEAFKTVFDGFTSKIAKICLICMSSNIEKAGKQNTFPLYFFLATLIAMLT